MYQLPVLFVLHFISCFEEWGRGLNTMSQILYCSVINNLWASNILSARHTDKTNTRSTIHQKKSTLPEMDKMLLVIVIGRFVVGFVVWLGY